MTCLKFGITGVFPLNIVGNQQADRSSGARHEVAPTPAFCRDSSVVCAFVVALPVKLCSCEAPGRFGKTIGSSGSRWFTSQLTWNSWWVTSSSAWAGADVSRAAMATPHASARCRFTGLLLGRDRGRALSQQPGRVGAGCQYLGLDMP